MDIAALKKLLRLEPLLVEGGFFSETYRCEVFVERSALPTRYSAGRACATAIYYLLTADTFSALHRLRSDETYHFYLGDPVELVLLRPDGRGEVRTLGQDIFSGMRVQFTVPHGVWQGSRLRPGGKFALLGTTMSPGFDPADFELAQREELSRSFPEFSEWVQRLTRDGK